MKKVLMFVRNDVTYDSRVKKEATSLGKAGFRVRIVGIALPEIVVEDESPYYTITRIRLKNTDLYRRIYNILVFTIHSIRIALIEKPIILTAHDLDTLLPAVISYLFSGARIVYDSHELYPETKENPVSRIMWSAIEAILIRMTKARITVNEYIASELNKKYKLGKEPVVIYNYPRISDWSLVKKDLIRSKLGISRSTKVIIYHGLFKSGRGLEELVKAAGYFQNGVLVLMGCGELRDRIVNLIQEFKLNDKVYIIQRVPTDDVLTYVSSADIGVILYENVEKNNYYCSPNKLFDYIAANVPMLVSDLPFLRKVIETNKIGVLCNSIKPEEIADKLNYILNNEELYYEFKRNLMSIHKNYTWEAQENRFVAVYNSLI